jgi:glycosyltransferase involved in cell wall biosynthesis
MRIPLVSVAMPVYNSEKYIRQAIDSVLAQTCSDFELVIVNDGSSDRSKEIILSYADERIRYMENEKNLGIVKTRNRCIEHSAGKYIAVLDNDDIALPSRLEEQVRFLEANNDYGVCGSFYWIIDGKGKLISKKILPVTDREVKTYLLFDNCFCNSSVMIRSELLKERPYAEGLDKIEDYYFLYMVSKFKKLTNLPVFATQYRVHGKNVSIESLDDMILLRGKMDRMILEDLGISFSEAEFMLHTNFATGNFRHFVTTDQKRQLESWLLKLYAFLKSREIYDMQLVEKIFIRRWILLVSNSSKFSPLILFNKLFGTFNIRYIRYFLQLIVEKFSKIKSVS